MRYVVSIVIGLVTGAMLATMGMKFLQEQGAWPRAVMTILGAEMKRTRDFAEQRQCNSAEAVTSLAHLELMANDIDRVLLAGHEDRVFSQYSRKLADTVNDARAALPDCEAYSVAITQVGDACSACHRDYR